MKKEIIKKTVLLFVVVSFLCMGITSVIGNNNHRIYDRKIQSEIGNKDLQIEEELTNIQVISLKQIIFEKLIVILMKLANLPAMSAAIVKNNNCTWSEGFGLYNIENNQQATDETIYIVASISKTFTATAIMQLYEKGLFELDDDVNDYLPFSLRNPKYPDEKITFRMLLAHQSSIAQDIPTFFTTLMPGSIEIVGYPDPFLRDYLVPGGIHYKSHVWNDYLPGEDMYYANIGYAILGYLVEILSNESFEDYCIENIFEPLEMKNSSFILTKLNISQIAVPYDYIYGKYYPYLHYRILDYPAGGLRTTIKDLSNFLITIINDGVYGQTRILTENSIQEMHKVQYPSNNYGFQYGLGWQIWEQSDDIKIGHTGGLYGVTTKMVFRKSDETGVIFFLNKYLKTVRDIVAYSLIEQLLFWKASSFDSKEIQEPTIRQTINSNQHIKNIYNIQKIFLYNYL